MKVTKRLDSMTRSRLECMVVSSSVSCKVLLHWCNERLVVAEALSFVCAVQRAPSARHNVVGAEKAAA